MVTETKDRFVNTKKPIENDGMKRQPHERDESPDAQDQEPRGIIKQAAEDMAQGLVNTDMYGTNGEGDLDRAVKPASGATGQANPLPDANRSMRRHDTTNDESDKNNL